MKKSIKERYTWKIDEITDIIRSYCDVDIKLFESCNIIDDYYFDIKSGKINSISKREYENKFLKAFTLCHKYLENGDVGNHNRKELISDFLDVISELEESKKENKNMRKSIKERFNPSKYWDFTALVEQYGMEFLSENYPDDEPFSMDDFNDIVGKDCWEAVRACFYGGRYGFKNDSFNPTDEWFKYDRVGNLQSIPYLDDYLESEVDEKEFYTWCVDNGYFDEEE